jgi:hypothetical protein
VKDSLRLGHVLYNFFSYLARIPINKRHDVIAMVTVYRTLLLFWMRMVFFPFLEQNKTLQRKRVRFRHFYIGGTLFC